jgi:hypothetical protein
MPITGLPNPQIHRMCKRCCQWFNYHEVELCWPPRRGMFSMIHGMLAENLDQVKEKKNYCAACQALNEKEELRFRKNLMRGMLSFFIILLAIIAAWALGVEEMIRNMATGRR